MIRQTAAATLAASTLLAGPASAHETMRTPLLDALTRTVVQTGLGFLRGVIDLTYDAVTVDARSGAVTLSGLTLHPELPWDDARACRIGVERLTLADAGDATRLDGTATLSGVTMPSACLEPGQAAMVASFGFETITADSVSITSAYDAPSAGLSLVIEASVEDALALTVSADFDYFSPRAGDWDLPDPENPEAVVEDAFPAATLGQAEIIVENRGLFETVQPMLEAQLGDLQAIPALAQAGALQAFGEGGQREPSPAERAFAEDLAEALGVFVEERSLLVISSDPEPGVRLGEEVFESPATIIAALQPTVSNRPLARAGIVDPALLATAMETPDDLSDADRRRLGLALLSGSGAPRMPGEGLALLEPLALAGDGEVAAAMARALAEDGDLEAAYRAALEALAAGNSDAASLADRLEGALSLDTVLTVQADLREVDTIAALPGVGEAVAAGDLPALRRLAEAHATGIGAPRDVLAALSLATVAAAGGDRASTSLMRRLENRYRAREEDAEALATLRDEAGRAAMTLWLDEGLAARMR